MIVVQTLYKMKKKRGMFMENEQSVVLTNWKRNYLFFYRDSFCQESLVWSSNMRSSGI